MIYLDHAATTYPHDDVVESMQPYLDTHHRNPSARYASAESSAVADARENIADLIGAAPGNIVFALVKQVVGQGKLAL